MGPESRIVPVHLEGSELEGVSDHAVHEVEDRVPVVQSVAEADLALFRHVFPLGWQPNPCVEGAHRLDGQCFFF